MPFDDDELAYRDLSQWGNICPEFNQSQPVERRGTLGFLCALWALGVEMKEEPQPSIRMSDIESQA